MVALIPRLAEDTDLKLMTLKTLVGCLPAATSTLISSCKLKHPILLRIAINQVAEDESFYIPTVVILTFFSTSSSYFTFFLKLCDIITK